MWWAVTTAAASCLRGHPHDGGARGPVLGYHGRRHQPAWTSSPRSGGARPGVRPSWRDRRPAQPSSVRPVTPSVRRSTAACPAVPTTGERAAWCSASMVDDGGLPGRSHDRGARGPALCHHGGRQRPARPSHDWVAQPVAQLVRRASATCVAAPQQGSDPEDDTTTGGRTGNNWGRTRNWLSGKVRKGLRIIAT